ncbi:MAG: hypothetical protein ACFBSD_09405 [Paracoccaceae bacterium]
MMERMAVAVATALALAGSAGAEPRISPGDVLSAIDGRWNRDALLERAVLVEGELDSADLYLFATMDGPRDMALVATGRGIVWSGALYGTLPRLERAENGSLRLLSQNTAIGRHRWEQVLTIAHRGGAYVVAGFSYAAFDTLDPTAETSCDVNLLTGLGIRDGKTVQVPAAAVPVSAWTDDAAPQVCFD